IILYFFIFFVFFFDFLFFYLFFFFFFFFFFFNDTATTEIYTLSLHDALPISKKAATAACMCPKSGRSLSPRPSPPSSSSDEHTSELQSREELECRLLLET